MKKLILTIGLMSFLMSGSLAQQAFATDEKKSEASTEATRTVSSDEAKSTSDGATTAQESDEELNRRPYRHIGRLQGE